MLLPVGTRSSPVRPRIFDGFRRYLISVRDRFSEWTVQRRYADFVTVHTEACLFSVLLLSACFCFLSLTVVGRLRPFGVPWLFIDMRLWEQSRPSVSLV